jgi:hypothetical protein
MSFLPRLVILVALLVTSLSASTAIQAQDAQTLLGCRIEQTPLALNGQATLIVEITNVQNLYGYELNMTYDGSRVRIQDADAEKSETNLQLGAFISPDFVVFNRADNGVINLALTQLAPNGPRSGSGELARATLVGIGAGFANFAFGEVTLSDANGQVIPVTTQDCLVEVGAAGEPTPTATATPLPTATPTEVAVFTDTPTPAPQSPTATFTPLPAAPTDTPVPAETTQPEPTPTETPTVTPTVLTITTPDPLQGGAGSTMTQAQTVEQQAPTATTLPMTLPAETTAATQTPFSQEAADPSQPIMPAAGQEVLSPPRIESDLAGETNLETETGAENQTEEFTTPGEAVSEISPAVPPASTQTPVAIARAEQAPALMVEAIQQPQGATPLVRQNYLQELGWLFLLFTAVLAVVAWRLRKA